MLWFPRPFHSPYSVICLAQCWLRLSSKVSTDNHISVLIWGGSFRCFDGLVSMGCTSYWVQWLGSCQEHWFITFRNFNPYLHPNRLIWRLLSAGAAHNIMSSSVRTPPLNYCYLAKSNCHVSILQRLWACTAYCTMESNSSMCWESLKIVNS